MQQVRQAGPLDVQVHTDTGKDVNLQLENQYPTQDMGNKLTTEQIDKLDTIRAEAPDKYQILGSLFPRQIAEFLLRGPKPAAGQAGSPLSESVQNLVWDIATQYLSKPQGHEGEFTEGQRHARADFIRAAAQSLPAMAPALQHLLEQAGRYEDPDFSSAQKADTFLVLKDWYSPYRESGMSIVGDTLRIDGSVMTERLSADATAAGMTPEQYASDYFARYSKALAHWRSGQVSGNAYAGSIRRFLNDPRLAEFTPEEVSRAYARVYGRDLKTDLEADQLAAKLGHPVTYNELRQQVQGRD